MIRNIIKCENKKDGSFTTALLISCLVHNIIIQYDIWKSDRTLSYEMNIKNKINSSFRRIKILLLLWQQ